VSGKKPPSRRTPTVSVRPGWRLSVRLLDAKGELAKAPGDAVKVEEESRALTDEETRALRARIDAKLEACQQGYEKAREKPGADGERERAFYVFSALNFCGGRPLPYWLRMAATVVARSQLPATQEREAFLLNERLLIKSLAAGYKAKGVSNAATKAEHDVAELFGLSVEGLRQKRYRARKALGIADRKRGRPRN
jgi:hypothetical protein